MSRLRTSAADRAARGPAHRRRTYAAGPSSRSSRVATRAGLDADRLLRQRRASARPPRIRADTPLNLSEGEVMDVAAGL